MITNHNFFLEILKAVCLSVDWVAKLIQKFFSTKEQKLVQSCETDIVADACNASYLYKAPSSVALHILKYPSTFENIGPDISTDSV